MLKLGKNIFVVIGDYGDDIGIGYITETAKTFDAVVRNVYDWVECEGYIDKFRVIRIDLHHETNLPFQTVDITLEVIDNVNYEIEARE